MPFMSVAVTSFLNASARISEVLQELNRTFCDHVLEQLFVDMLGSLDSATSHKS